MAQPHWGVDTFNKANAFVGTSGKTFWEWITDIYGGPPEFWGRYLNGDKYPVLDSAEVAFLRDNDRNCRILPIVIPHPGRMVTPGKQGYANGVRSGITTIEMADNLHMPADVFIYVDIEPNQPVSEGWMDGWTDMMEKSKYGGSGGFYCSPRNYAFCTPYCKLLKDFPTWRQSERSIWSVTPFRGNCDEIPSTFEAHSPPGDEGVAAVWQYATDCHGHRIDLDLANDAGFAAMWGGQAPPERHKTPHGNVVATPIGRWDVNVGVFEWIYVFFPGGLAKWAKPDTPTVFEPTTGTWTMEDALMKIEWTTGAVEKWRLPLNTDMTVGELVGQGPIIDARQLSDVPI
jgi:hypothetical protein